MSIRPPRSAAGQPELNEDGCTWPSGPRIDSPLNPPKRAHATKSSALTLALAASLVAAGCTLAPATPLLQTGGGGYGSVCGPGGSVLIGIDILHNVSDGPVTVDKIELDSPTNLELAGWRLLDDPSQGGPRVNDGVIDGHFGPGLIQPGQIAAVDVALNATIRDSPGWTNGLWVYGTGQSGQRVGVRV